MKIGICTDSSSGISLDEAKKMGVEVISLPFTINDKEYLEGVNIEKEEFFKMIDEGAKIHTSQPSIDTLQKTWNKMLKEYDAIIYMPITSGLSSSCNTASLLSEEDVYKGKVFVVNNEKISVLLRYAIEDCKKLIEKGYDPQKIKAILEKNSKNTVIYIMVSDLSYLEKGGRLNPIFAKLGNILRIKPILYSDGGKFGIYEKTRTIEKTKSIVLDAIDNDLKTKFGYEEGKTKYSVGVAHIMFEEEARKFKSEMESRFPNVSRPICMDELSLVIACHIGPGAIGVALYKDIDELDE